MLVIFKTERPRRNPEEKLLLGIVVGSLRQILIIISRDRKYELQHVYLFFWDNDWNIEWFKISVILLEVLSGGVLVVRKNSNTNYCYWKLRYLQKTVELH